MRYHFEPEITYDPKYGKVYSCNHPLYNNCTLYLQGEKGLAIVQQRLHLQFKQTWWSEIDPWLQDPIYEHPKFQDYFNKNAGIPDQNGLYPTIPVRKVMWALKMKPLKKERWETTFDRQFL